jgi:hypothetical protein
MCNLCNAAYGYSQLASLSSSLQYCNKRRFALILARPSNQATDRTKNPFCVYVKSSPAPGDIHEHMGGAKAELVRRCWPSGTAFQRCQARCTLLHQCTDATKQLALIRRLCPFELELISIKPWQYILHMGLNRATSRTQAALGDCIQANWITRAHGNFCRAKTTEALTEALRDEAHSEAGCYQTGAR